MEIDFVLLNKIRNQAIAAYPLEAVWLYFAEDVIVPVKNVSETPDKDFRVSKSDMVEAYGKGLKGIIHSHPDYPQCPSASDMRGQLSTDLPWGIIATDGFSATDVLWYGDMVPKAPLIGRGFIHGVQDCYSLIRDYYSTDLGIKLPEYPRDWEWWNKGQDLYRDGVTEAGFYQVDWIEDLKPGDMIWMQLRSNVPSHGAIYLGNEMILHHITSRKPVDHSRLSVREPIHRWLDYIVGAYRHKESKYA